MKFYEPKPGVITLGLLSPSEASEALEELKAASTWKPARVTNRRRSRAAKDVRSASVLSLDESSFLARVFEARIRTVVRPLIYERWKCDLVRYTSPHVVRYLPGDFYREHRDSSGFLADRYFSIVCYINADFTGGGTYFPDSGYTVQPEAGKAVIFPSDYLHRANAIESGMKYVAIAWMLDTPPVKWI